MAYNVRRFSVTPMNTVATIHWGYVGLVVIALCALVASPFLVVLIRGARAIANTSSDDFRLNNPNMWTEAHHTKDGGFRSTDATRRW
jgi:hypothetical protein